MSWLQRWTPRLVIGLGWVHFGYSLIAREVQGWRGIVGDGLFAAVGEGGPDYFPRVFALYFFSMGFFLLTLGSVARWTLARTGRIPSQIGWCLTAGGTLLSVVEFPVTGGWAVLILGIMMLLAARRPVSPSSGMPGSVPAAH